MYITANKIEGFELYSKGKAPAAIEYPKNSFCEKGTFMIVIYLVALF